MADEGFQLPRSAYEEIRNIIVAYGHLSEPGTLQDVSEYGGMSKATISRNNGFLVSTGVLEAGKKKVLTRKGKRLADVIAQDLPSETASRWQEIVAESDFLQKILAAVKIRRGMERSALESHVAYTAGEKKTGRVMTGAAAVIDILMDADLLRQEDGKLVVGDEQPSRAQGEADDQPHLDQFTGTPSTAAGKGKVYISEGQTVSVGINIEVSVSCTVEEMDQLGAQLRRIVESVQPYHGEPSQEDPKEE